jgi:hypothetical protein
MRKTAVKALRKIINPSSPISRRVFRRLKKKYNSIPHNERAFFKTLRLKEPKQSQATE